MESRIQEAMRSRLQHFKDQSDSLTFEGVRRLLEKDLALDTYALDAHKKFVKHLLEKYLSGTEDDDNVSNGSKQIKLEDVKEEEEERPTTDESRVEDSPVMELLSAKESAKSGSSETQGNANEKIPTETMIKEALWNKATYFRSNSEELTVAGVRRLLEEDLDLKKFSLDSFKKLISKQLDLVLNSENDSPKKKGSKSKADGENDIIEAEVKPKKKLAPKGKVQKSEGPMKRKRPAQETERARKKKIKNDEEQSVEKNNVQDVDDESESSAEKPVKKEVAASYGKEVERLRSIIKACGMSISPAIYKKAKQAPEDKREAILIKELQNILSKEGLSTNPSEKEIKEVKRRKERAKELEGIDTSNIVVGSRRRSTFNFVAPPKPKAPIESDGDPEDSDNEEGDGSEDTDNDNGNDNSSQGTDNNNKDGDDIHEDDTLHKDGDDIHEDDTLHKDGDDIHEDDALHKDKDDDDLHEDDTLREKVQEENLGSD